MRSKLLTRAIACVCLIIPAIVSAQIRPAGKIAVAPAPAPSPKIEVVRTDLAVTTVSDANNPAPIKGTLSSDAENNGSERDTYASIPRALSPLISGRLSAHTRRLKDDPNIQTYLDVAKLGLNGFEIHTSLLAGHKYMIADCLGIKIHAGDFIMRVPDPDLRVDNTGLVLTFNISQITMTAVGFRFRPDVFDLVEPCHFSGSQGIGVSAENVRLEMHFDPILDLEQCKIGSMGHVTNIWRIGKLRMAPLPSAVADLSANIVEDALTYVSNFNVVDRLVAGLNGAAGSQCHA
jgi:hypothetical protein